MKKIHPSILVFALISLGLGSVIRWFSLHNLGFFFDMIYTQFTWGTIAYRLGVFQFWRDYPLQNLFDYPFLSLCLEYLIAALVAPLGQTPFQFVAVLKAMNWLSEVLIIGGMIALVWAMITRVGSASKSTNVAWQKFLPVALVFAAISYLTPSVWFVGMVWGQNDTLLFSLTLISIILLTKKKFFLSGLIFCFALLIKPQPLMILPILFLFFMYRQKLADILKHVFFMLPLCVLGAIIGWLVSRIHVEQLQPYLQTVPSGTYPDALYMRQLIEAAPQYSLVFGLCFLLLVMMLFLFGVMAKTKNVFRPVYAWLFGIVVLFVPLHIPLLWLNPIRTLAITFQTAMKANTTNSGAANFFTIINKSNIPADTPLFSVGGVGIQVGLVGTLIYSVLMVILVCRFYGWNLRSLRKIGSDRLFSRALALKDMIFLLTVHASLFFAFTPKMHSRYLHFGILFSLLSALIIWASKIGSLKSRLYLTFSLVLMHAGYFLNQLALFSSTGDNFRCNPDFIDQTRCLSWVTWIHTSMETSIYLSSAWLMCAGVIGIYLYFYWYYWMNQN